jgi:hypothetical protein
MTHRDRDDRGDPGSVVSLTVRAVGCRVVVGLRGLDDDAVAGLAAAWARCEPVVGRVPEDECAVLAELGSGAAADGPGPADRPDLIRSDDPAQLAEAITTAVTQVAIDRRRSDLLLLHAGATAAPDGSVLAFVAPSGHGKTTASAALGRELGYVTDETVAVDDAGVVVPYPKPLSVRGEAQRGRSRPKSQVSPDERGLLPVPHGPLTLRRVVLLERDPLAEGVTVTPVGLADAGDRLFPQISFLGSRPRALRRVQALLDRTGGLLVVRYAEASTLAPVVRALLADGGRATEPTTPPPTDDEEARARPAEEAPVDEAPATTSTAVVTAAAVTAAAVPTAALPTAVVTAAAVDDWIVDGDAVVVLRDDQLRTLREVGVVLWRAARAAGARGVDLAGLTAAVVAAHGLPDDRAGADARAATAVAEAVDQLVTAELLERRA